jgi:hypothetical protein
MSQTEIDQPVNADRVRSIARAARAACERHGIYLRMSTCNDLIAFALYDEKHNAAVPKANAGLLGPVTIDFERIARAAARYGVDAEALESAVAEAVSIAEG